MELQCSWSHFTWTHFKIAYGSNFILLIINRTQSLMYVSTLLHHKTSLCVDRSSLLIDKTSNGSGLIQDSAYSWEAKSGSNIYAIQTTYRASLMKLYFVTSVTHAVETIEASGVCNSSIASMLECVYSSKDLGKIYLQTSVISFYWKLTYKTCAGYITSIPGLCTAYITSIPGLCTAALCHCYSYLQSHGMTCAVYITIITGLCTAALYHY